MRVQSIELYSNSQRVVQFDVNGPDFRNPYVLKSIAGLDADEITPLFYGQGTESNTKFYDLVLQPREIVMRIGLNPDYSLGVRSGDLRTDLLKAIGANRSGKMQLRLVDDEVPVGVINGFVTKFEANVSNKEAEVLLTLRCDDPLFKTLHVSNQIVTELDELNPLIIDPISTAPHGFYFHLTFTGSVNPFIIRDTTTPDWKFQINYPFIVDDQLFFSSEVGNKYIYRIRAGATLHLMDVLEQGSIWPILFPGENQFNTLPAGGGATFVWNEMYWHDTHWGV